MTEWIIRILCYFTGIFHYQFVRLRHDTALHTQNLRTPCVPYRVEKLTAGRQMSNRKIKWNAAHIPKTCTAKGGERTEWSFEGVEGLVLDCTASGDRIWKVRYRVKDGGRRVERKLPIGLLDPEARRRSGNEEAYLSPGQAKDRADDVLGQVRNGGDPWLEKHEKEHRPKPEQLSVKAVYFEWLDRPGRRRTLRRRTREGYEQQFRDYIEPFFGNWPITDLRKQDIAAAVEKVRKATTNPDRGMRGLQSTKVLKLIRSICRYALTKDYIVRDPTLALDFPVPEDNPDGRQSRPPTDEELRLMWVEAPKRLSPQIARILKIGFLLGKRVSEIVNAKKSEIQFGPDAHWKIPGTTEGNKSREDQIVPLPSLAIALFQEQLDEAKDSPFVFPAKGKPDRPTTRHTPSQAFTELRRLVGIEDQIRFHDVRSLIVDHLAKLGVPSEYRSHVLHHTGDMRKTLADSTYSTWDFLYPKRRALELWERRLLEIVEGRPPTGEQWTA